MPALRKVVLLMLTGGPVMTVTHEPPRPKRVGSLHVRTLTHEEGSNADVGSFQAARLNPICATS
jgi:hypothetical protein